MSKVSLKITIAGRTYPLNVLETEQNKVLKAADDINKAIELLSKSYAVKDTQDLLAMSALQLITRNVAQSKTEILTIPADYTSIEASLEVLSKEIDSLN
jgi:cell division protein ZapA (FtsZ GTPase activity inhibitor)